MSLRPMGVGVLAIAVSAACVINTPPYGASCGDARIVYVYFGNNSWIANSASSKSPN